MCACIYDVAHSKSVWVGTPPSLKQILESEGSLIHVLQAAFTSRMPSSFKNLLIQLILGNLHLKKKKKFLLIFRKSLRQGLLWVFFFFLFFKLILFSFFFYQSDQSVT